MSPVDEGLWNHLMTGRWMRWKRRSMDGALTGSQRRYADRRARRMDSEYQARLENCARAGVVVKCGCPGKRGVRWYSCRQNLLCSSCRKSRSKRMRARIFAGLERASSMNPGLMVVLITLTVRHTGDIGADRESLARGWRRFYKAYHRRFGAFPYVGTHEITPGDDKLGHPHAHVVALWPFRDWGMLAELWRAACPESTRINFRASRNTKHAARYVSKYVSKGVQGSDFSPELRARVLAGTYGTRWMMTSVRFWVPFEPRCACCDQPVRRAMLRDPFPDAAHSNWRRYDCSSYLDETSRWHQVDIEAFQLPDEFRRASGSEFAMASDQR